MNIGLYSFPLIFLILRHFDLTFWDGMNEWITLTNAIPPFPSSSSSSSSSWGWHWQHLWCDSTSAALAASWLLCAVLTSRGHPIVATRPLILTVGMKHWRQTVSNNHVNMDHFHSFADKQRHEVTQNIHNWFWPCRIYTVDWCGFLMVCFVIL